jgi:Spy/CpxP family protein refolding chaperone
MSLPLWKKFVVAAVLFTGAVSVPALLAQKPAAKSGEKPAAAAEKKKSVKRLPVFYADLVDGTQREKIYALQEKYDAQIAPLTEQIKEIQSKRDAEIEAVLNAEQKAKLEKARADAKAKAAERAAGKKTAEAKPTTDVPATAATARPATATVKPAGK